MRFPTVDALHNFRLVGQIHHTWPPIVTNSHVRVAQEVVVCVLPSLVVGLQERRLWFLQHNVLFLSVCAFAVVFVVHVTDGVNNVDWSSITEKKKSNYVSLKSSQLTALVSSSASIDGLQHLA